MIQSLEAAETDSIIPHRTITCLAADERSSTDYTILSRNPTKRIAFHTKPHQTKRELHAMPVN